MVLGVPRSCILQAASRNQFNTLFGEDSEMTAQGADVSAEIARGIVQVSIEGANAFAVDCSF